MEAGALRLKGPKLVTDDELKSPKGKAVKLPKSTAELLVPLLAAIYGTAALFTKQEHWKLDEAEAEEAAQALADALDTLPPGKFKAAQKLLASYAPWVGCAITFGSLTAVRIQESKRLAHVRTPQNNPGGGPAPDPTPAEAAGARDGSSAGSDGAAGSAGGNGRPRPAAVQLFDRAD